VYAYVWYMVGLYILSHLNVWSRVNSFFVFLHVFMCAYIVSFLPSAPHLLPLSSPHPTFRQNLFFPFLQFHWREDISNNKKVSSSWDKDSYIERFLALLPCKSVLQPKLIHLYMTSSLLPGHLPILTSVTLWLTVLAPLQWDIIHFQVLDFLPISIPPICALPLVCDPSPTTLLP
jgi:hypothetical protein